MTRAGAPGIAPIRQTVTLRQRRSVQSPSGVMASAHRLHLVPVLSLRPRGAESGEANHGHSENRASKRPKRLPASHSGLSGEP
jgi:hypothetical protein